MEGQLDEGTHLKEPFRAGRHVRIAVLLNDIEVGEHLDDYLGDEAL